MCSGAIVGAGKMGLRTGSPSGCGLLLSAGTALAQPRTLQEALAATYANNPALQAARAQLRATDEGVPPGAGRLAADRRARRDGRLRRRQQLRTRRSSGPATNNDRIDRHHPGHHHPAALSRRQDAAPSTNQAKNAVFVAAGEPDRVRGADLHQRACNAYVGVIQAQQLLQLNISNEQVLTGSCRRPTTASASARSPGPTWRRPRRRSPAPRAARDRRRATSRPRGPLICRWSATCRRTLVEPQPLQPAGEDRDGGGALAAANNPNVIAALFNDAAAKDAVDVAFSALCRSSACRRPGSRTTNSHQQSPEHQWRRRSSRA